MFLCYLPGHGRLSRHAFAQRNWRTVCRFQDYFNARPQPPGLSGTVTFTAALPEKFGKVTWAVWFSHRRPSSLVLGSLRYWFRGRGTKDEDERSNLTEKGEKGYRTNPKNI